MNTDALLRKLAPLLPEKVQRWREILPTVESEVRSLLEREIALTAKRHIGDIHSTILLPPPPAKASAGSIQLGKVKYVGQRGSAGVHPHELLQHLAVYGRSGAGKSNVVFHIIEQLTDADTKWLFIDFKRTARSLLPLLNKNVDVYTPGRLLAPLQFNPLAVPPGLEANVYTSQLVDALADAFTLGDGARSVLQKALGRCYVESESPSLDSVIQQVEAQTGNPRVQNWKITALRALESLRFAHVLASSQDEQIGLTQSLLKRFTILELDRLAHGAKTFLSSIIILWLYYVRMQEPNREKLAFVIVLEEAHNLLFRSSSRRRETILETVMRQCRELGIGLMIVDQNPSLLSQAAVGNVFSTICLNLADIADVNRAAGVLQLDDAGKRYLAQLQIGEGIVRKQNGHPAFLVKFPLMPIHKGSVSDEKLAEYRTGTPRSAWKAGLNGNVSRVSRSSPAGTRLKDAELRFLQDVLDHPDDPVRKRYRRLGLSARIGQRVKQHLLRQGWLEATLVPIGNTRKLVLRVSLAGRGKLGLVNEPATNSRNESLAHQYWKQHYAEAFQSLGFSVQLEASAVGGYVDVLAERHGHRIAFEMETGKSDAVQNVRNCLRSRFDLIVVVATDEAAFERVERQLVSAGLLIVDRVIMTLRDRFTKDFASARSHPFNNFQKSVEPARLREHRVDLSDLLGLHVSTGSADSHAGTEAEK